MEADRQLVARILAGDALAFQALVQQHERLVAHIVFRLVKNAQDRQELCQDVFLKVHRALGGFKFEAKLSTWIARIAYHHAVNFAKKKRLPIVSLQDLLPHTADHEPMDIDRALARKAAVPASAPAADAALLATQRQQALQLAMEKLPPLLRTLLSLFYQQELSLQEIGEVMGLPEGTLKSYLFRARAKLKDHLLQTTRELWT